MWELVGPVWMFVGPVWTTNDLLQKSIIPKTNKHANYELDQILVTVVREASGAPSVGCWIRI